ncbi:MAG: VWA domain-containing protein [Hyphomonadaceae bacterium]|nr:VWA domain-containing protein [Hyphomonadaceae bacterium]
MAEQVLTDFIRALRSADVRVSTGEAIDAAEAVKLIGYADRQRLSDTLRCVLAKSPAEKLAHDRLFDLYFSRRAIPQNAPPDDAESDTSESDADGPGDILDLMETGDETAIAMAMERAGQEAGLQDIRFSTQVSYFAQQMMKSLGVDRLESEMMQAFRERTEEGQAYAEELIEGRKDMFARAREHAKQAFETYGAGATLAFREDVLAETALTALDVRDLGRMQVLVEKIAKRLASKHSRRRRKKNRGQLDVRKTLRANAGFDGVPFDIAWKQTKRDRAKIVAVCDVSGSVARVVRFFLMLLYSLNEVVPDIESFAFSGRLEDVGPTLETDDFAHAMDKIINDIGMSSTDYGQSLSDLRMNHWDALDRRTTLIVLGDGRSNYGDPRLDLFREAAARVKRVIWLTPEGESLWGTGDSELPRYRPHCHTMKQVTTIKDLERILDEALSRYA